MGKALMLRDCNFSENNLGKVTLVDDAELKTSLLPSIYSSLDDILSSEMLPFSPTADNGYGWNDTYMNGINLVTAIILPSTFPDSEITSVIKFSVFDKNTKTFIKNIDISPVLGQSVYELDEPINLNGCALLAKRGKYTTISSSDYCVELRNSELIPSIVVIPYQVQGYTI